MSRGLRRLFARRPPGAMLARRVRDRRDAGRRSPAVLRAHAGAGRPGDLSMTTDLLRLTDALAGRYTIERELGAGGSATVYLAHDVRHRRPVAVKVLHREIAAAFGAERFRREI